MGTYKKAVRRVSNVLASTGLIPEGYRVTRRDQMRPADLISLKANLGPGFLRGTLTPASRRARIGALSKEEREVARARGWIR
jgi:hypothetical protein